MNLLLLCGPKNFRDYSFFAATLSATDGVAQRWERCSWGWERRW